MLPTPNLKPRGFGSIYQDTKRIVRAATPEEKIQLMKKLEEEDQVLKTCRAKVSGPSAYLYSLYSACSTEYTPREARKARASQARS